MKNISFPQWLKLEKKCQYIFCAMTLLFVIYVFPIIMADRYYQDDLSRSLRGITGWTNDARPLTELIMKWLCGGTPISDISPLPLLLSVIILAYSLTLYIQKNLSDLHMVYASLFVGILVIVNPFMLSTFSYRYDCVTMVIALCAAVIPYALPDTYACWKVFLCSAFLCMIILTTYQPCIGIYISLFFMELFFMIYCTEINRKRLIIRVFSVVVCIPPYYLFVMRHYMNDSSWQKNAYQFSLNSELFSSIQQNFDTLTGFIRRYLNGLPSYVIVLFGLLTIGGIIHTAFTIWTSDACGKVLRILYTICLPVLVTLCSLLPLLALTPSNFAISAHTLIVLCSFGLWAGVMLHLLADRFPRAVTLLMVPFLVFHMGFSYTYGNAMKEQKNYEEYVTYSIVHDIETLDNEYEYQYLTINGKLPQAPEVQMLCEKYPVFNSLVPTYINNNSYLGGALLRHYMQEDLEFTSMTSEDEDMPENSVPLISNSMYNCYINEDKIIVQFREASHAF